MPSPKTLTLRSVTVPTIGTFGTILTQDNKKICRTVEREWLDNEPSVSCIPAGLYQIKKTNSPKFGPCYCLVNKALGVTLQGPSQRTHILIHVANYPHQLKGCVAPGMSFMESSWGVSQSKIAFEQLGELLDEYIEETRNNVFLKVIRSEQ